MLHLEGLFAKRKVKILNDRRELSTLRLQRVWASGRLRVELAARVEATRRRIAAEREWGARMLQRLCRRRKDAKELALRFAIRKIILEQVRATAVRSMYSDVSCKLSWPVVLYRCCAVYPALLCYSVVCVCGGGCHGCRVPASGELRVANGGLCLLCGVSRWYRRTFRVHSVFS